jgi:hypothetical protein
MSLADELQKLRNLHESGAINDDEFIAAKGRLLTGSQSQQAAQAPQPAISSYDLNEQQTRQWSFFIHLSLLAGFLIPYAGLILPIVLWQIKKTEFPGTDVHGRIVVNWIISMHIYGVVCVILIYVLIGIPLLFALGIVSVVFPIIGAIKANNGEAWNYPLAIRFLG